MIEQGTNGITKDSIGLVESLADRLGAKARASTIYGEPVDREGVTVIPVARAIWGFGGGTGRDDEREAGAAAAGYRSQETMGDSGLTVQMPRSVQLQGAVPWTEPLVGAARAEWLVLRQEWAVEPAGQRRFQAGQSTPNPEDHARRRQTPVSIAIREGRHVGRLSPE